MNRFLLGLLAITVASGLMVGIMYAFIRAHTAFASRGVQAHIQARGDLAKRERDRERELAAPTTAERSEPRR